MSKTIRYVLGTFFLPILLLLISSAHSVQAQYDWSVNMDALYYNLGWVGIGTNVPPNRLSVGDNSVGSSQSPWATIGIGNASGDSAIQLGQSPVAKGYMKWIWSNHLQLGTVNAAHPLALQTAGGNVGVGTTNPQTRLQVQGMVSSSCFTTATTPHLTVANQWYELGVLNGNCNMGANTKILLTQDNSGTGDISIISLRVKKGSVHDYDFTIQYYVNAIPTPGTTKFNIMAVKQAF